ncbi:hypothetical protein [Robiginitomaculum antarcticum]|uniref:hypothetical protein n=1 Tax=Robiginitomaculum antarcticum TaxID=437507 RepID=UPI0003A3110B|nr:hypothetical protein [Robiginitomaculum antarcticum]
MNSELFPEYAPAEQEELGLDPANFLWVRKRLDEWMARAARSDMNPWNPVQARDIRNNFRELSELLPADEGRDRLAAFLVEMDRLALAG